MASVLVVCPTWVGDTVMATPVLRGLRAALPDAHLAAMLAPGLEEVLDGCGWIDEMIVRRDRGALGPWRAARVLRSRRRFDAALLLPNSFRTALTVRLARIPVRIGYGRDGRRRLLTHAVAVPVETTPVPAVRYYRELAETALGGEPIDARIELGVTDAQVQAADRLLDGVGAPLVVLNPGGNRADKRWPAERFAEVADALARHDGATVAVSGSPGERDLTRRIAAAAAAPIIDLADRGIGLGVLKAVLRRAALLVTNDTGPRHLAAALGTPVVSLFGPTDHRWTTLEGVRERVLLAEPFLPEALVADRHAEACAVEKIRTSDVLAAARALLGGPED
jgi:heptosyltransferase-2